MRHFRIVMNSVCILGASYLVAQAKYPAKPAPTREVQVATLKLDEVELTSLGKQGTIMSANYTCASDGSLFVQVADSPDDIMLSLHALGGPDKDIRFDPGVVQGYDAISWPLNYFVNGKHVAALVEAEHSANLIEKNKKAEGRIHLVLIYDRKGVLEHVVPVPAQVDAKSIGLYASGDLLIIGINKSDKTARLFVLDMTGSIKNEFLLFDNDYNAAPDAVTKQPLAALIPDGALAFTQIIPHGENLLLFPRTTSQAVIEVNEGGVVRSIQLQLPLKQTLSSFLSASDTSWKIRTFAKIDSNGAQYEGPVFEFNPFDGALIRRIDLPKDSPAILACEHDGVYTALTTDPKTGQLELLRGHIATSN